MRLYAKVFVDPRGRSSELIGAIASALNAPAVSSIIDAESCEIEVRVNRDRPEVGRYVAREDRFLFFPFAVEVESDTQRLPLDGFLGTLATVMRALAAVGMEVVAACSWEDQLPGGGRLGA